MTGGSRPHRAAPAPQQKPEPKLSAEDQRELSLIEASIGKIKNAVPAVPYILSTPSLYPYKHYSQQEAEAFMRGGLFRCDEESIQYRTFMFREPYQDCFVVQSGESMEQLEPERERRPSQAATTPHLGPKKKISLSEYKASKANGSTGASVSMKQIPVPPPTKPSAPQTNGVKEPAKQALAPKPEEPKLRKQPAQEIPLPKKPEKRPDDTPAPPAQDKPKPKDSSGPHDDSADSNGTPHGLPPLISPVHHPMNNPHGLPPILSPTLPSNVLAELDRIKRGESNITTESPDRKSKTPVVPEPKPSKRADETNSRVQSASVNVQPSKTTTERKVASPPTLIVKLKYGKRLATRVVQILKLPPSRKAQAAVEKKEKAEKTVSSKERTPAKHETKAPEPAATKAKDGPKITSRPASGAPKVPEKRPRTDDVIAATNPTKRQKPSQDGLNTPTQLRGSSPSLPTKSSAQKSQATFTTPRKDIKASDMLRTKSAESNVPTPGDTANTPSSVKTVDTRAAPTPTSVKHVDKAAPTSAPVRAKPPGDPQALAEVSRKFNHLGRTLKYEVSSTNTNKLSKEDRMKVAVTCIDCVLSYMAAFGTADLSNMSSGRLSNVEGTWKTLLPLANSYRSFTGSFPHLDGLRHYLCAVTNAVMCSHIASRTGRDKAHDSPQNGTAPGRPTDVEIISRGYRELVQSIQVANVALPLDDIQKHYPKTWSRRETSYLKASERPGVLPGPYFLPISVDTTPLQAVRFGLALLKEFIVKQNVDYTLRVSLE